VPVKKLTVSFDFPFSPIKLSADWEPAQQEREAAWEMYVELATRVTVIPLPEHRGLVREAITSYYSLFTTTREILKKYGPTAARPSGKGSTSFGQLAVVILNELLRPFLSEWHPALEDWESQRPDGISRLAHEREWDRHQEIRDALEKTRFELERYAVYLAQVAEVPVLTTPPAESD
jgi:hypothetical protein